MPDFALRGDAPPPVDFDQLLQALDAQCAALGPNLLGRFRFDLGGRAVEMRRLRRESGDRYVIEAKLGHLPFSIESSDRRRAARAIVDATHHLPHVRFSIGRGGAQAGRVTANGVFETPLLAAPESLFYPLTLFWQEARPFMALIGKYL